MSTRTFFSNIAGATQQNEDGSDRQTLIRDYCKPGMALILIREPDNSGDKDAIQVWIEIEPSPEQKQTVQLGFIPVHTAHDLAGRIDRKIQVLAKITKVTGGSYGESFGANIEISIVE